MDDDILQKLHNKYTQYLDTILGNTNNQTIDEDVAELKMEIKSLEFQINKLNSNVSGDNYKNEIDNGIPKPKRTYTKIKHLTIQEQTQHKKMMNRKKQSKYRQSSNGKIVYKNYRESDHAKLLNVVYNKKYREKKRKELQEFQNLKILLESLTKNGFGNILNK